MVEPSDIWRDYATLAMIPIIAGTSLMVLGSLARELMGRWLHG